MPRIAPRVGLELDDVVALVDSDEHFRDFLTGSLSTAEVTDAGIVLQAWRALLPKSSLLDRLDHQMRKRALSDVAVFRARAYLCSHGVADHDTWDTMVRGALERVRGWWPRSRADDGVS